MFHQVMETRSACIFSGLFYNKRFNTWLKKFRKNATIMDWKNFKCANLAGSQLAVTVVHVHVNLHLMLTKTEGKEWGKKEKKHVKASFVRT